MKKLTYVESLLLPNNQTTPTRPLETPTPTPPPLKPKAGGLSAGTKAGIAVGVIALVVIIAAVIFFLRGRRRNRQEQRDDSSERALGQGELTDRSVTFEIGGKQLGWSHIGHHIQQGADTERRTANDIELEARTVNDGVPVLGIDKQWEYKTEVVELDATGGKN